MTEPKMGDMSTCQQCGRPIQYVGPMWRHSIDGKGKEYRHRAKPVGDNQKERQPGEKVLNMAEQPNFVLRQLVDRDLDPVVIFGAPVIVTVPVGTAQWVSVDENTGELLESDDGVTWRWVGLSRVPQPSIN